MHRRFHRRAQAAVAFAAVFLVAFAYLRGVESDDVPVPLGNTDGVTVSATVTGSGTETVRAEPRAEVHVPVLVYHHIWEEKKGLPPGKRLYDITPAEFEAHLSYLKDNGYETITFAQLREAFAGGALPEKPVLLTFDDGRADQYPAWQALRARGFTGTWFVFTNGVGRPDYLTWEQLAEMRDGGAEIESHTLYHPYLTKATDEDLAHELVKSREMLRSHLGVEAAVVAYPFGLVDERVREATRTAGYAMGRGLAQTNVQRADAQLDIGGWIATGDMRQFRGIFGDR